MFFERIFILLVIYELEFTRGQQYILDPQLHFQVQDDYHNRKKPIEFQQHFPGFSSIDSFIPQRDLQTSDVPVYLQKTLPQYRLISKEQLSKNQYHNGVLLRPDHEGSSQNIVPSTHRPNYSHLFSKNHHAIPHGTEPFLGQVTLDNSFESVNNFYKNHENTKQRNAEEGKPIPPVILRQHTRILAPDPEDKQNQLQENKYFVNENGEVIATTIISPKRLSTILEVEDESRNSQESPQNNVIKNYGKTSYLSRTEDQNFNSEKNFDLTDYEYEDDIEMLTTPTIVGSTASEHINNTRQESNPSSEKKEKNEPEKINKSSKHIDKNNNTEINEFSEPIVSVVTTKSVINNTIVATNRPPVTFESTTPSHVENSTDSWVVVASVQTSKSISGAHYLPSSIVAQEERFALLNEKDHENNSSEEASTELYSSYEEYDSESTTEEITTIKHSTESLIDKLDRVQSDLSSGLLTGGYKNGDNNIAVITENMTDKIQVTQMTESPTETSQLFPSVSNRNFPIIKKFSSRSRPPTSSLYPKRKPIKKTSTTPKAIFRMKVDTTDSKPNLVIAKPDAYLPPGYNISSEKDVSSELVVEILKKLKDSRNNMNEDNELTPVNKSVNNTSVDTPHHRFGSSYPSSTKISMNSTNNESNSVSSTIERLLKIPKSVDIKDLLPPGYEPQPETIFNSDDAIWSKKKNDQLTIISPSHESKVDPTKSSSFLADIELSNNMKHENVISISPAASKPTSTFTTKKYMEDILNKSKAEDTRALLPPEYKTAAISIPKIPTKIDELFQNSKKDDVSAFLPPGYKTKSTSSTSISKIEDIFDKSKKDDISAFLPPGFKPKFTTRKPITKSTIQSEELPTSLLPSGYKPRKNGGLEHDNMISSTDIYNIPSMSTTTVTTTAKGSLKVVFPSRPGGKRINHKLTTQRAKEERKEVTQAPVPTIHKGWPTRATTEFTGWPTPSTTPISIEQLLESVQRVSPTSAEPENITFTTMRQITITSATTQKPTTPGICTEECDLVGTIKLVDGVKWVPELLDRNTKEWKILANEVQSQLEEVYSKSESLSSYFKNLRIDGFSQGSVLVDYLVEMQKTDMYVSTAKMKKLFNEALEGTFIKPTPREGKSLNETVEYVEKAKLGRFVIDPMYTDFIVVPKQYTPTVGYAEDNLLLPQWAIAVIVIGLASLLFVIIFGVTVLVNRSKNAKKKAPTPLTDDMLNELNKDHMGGYDNYGIEDPYSMEAGFWDPRRIEAHREYNKFPKKGSTGSIHDNSMTNLYDSWNSQNNGFQNHATGSYYGQHAGPGSSHRLYERRRSYDTNF